MKTRHRTTRLLRKFREPTFIVAILSLFVAILSVASRYHVSIIETAQRHELVMIYYDRVSQSVGGVVGGIIDLVGNRASDEPTPTPTQIAMVATPETPAVSTPVPVPTQLPTVIVVTATPIVASVPADESEPPQTNAGGDDSAIVALSYPLPFPQQLRGSKPGGSTGGGSTNVSAAGGPSGGFGASSASTPSSAHSDDDHGEPFYRGNVVVNCLQSDMGVFINRLTLDGFWERLTDHSHRPVAGDSHVKIDGIPLLNAPDRKADPIMVELVKGPEATVLGRVGDYANGMEHLRALYPDQDLVITCSEVQAVIQAAANQ